MTINKAELLGRRPITPEHRAKIDEIKRGMELDVAMARIAPVPRTALTLEEAAASMGVSVRHFRRHVLPHIRTVKSGTARVVPVPELVSFLERTATHDSEPS